MSGLINTDDDNLKMQGRRGVIVNVDNDDYERYLRQKKIADGKTLQIGVLENEINSMKSEISQMKAILQQFVQGNK